MSEPFSKFKFPKADSLVRARWAPIFLSPIFGSPECFVIAVAVANEEGYHIESANELKRLECLYGRSAETAIFAAEVALDELDSALIAMGEKALIEGALVFSGVSIGAVTDGEARSFKHLARTWMSALSSLYKYREDIIEQSATDSHDGTASDRLPALVLEHVKKLDPSLATFFSEDIRQDRKRRSPSTVAEVSIDFSGSKLVSNFATLQFSATSLSVDRIKRKMFDLKVRRDKEGGLLTPRFHEMILFAPSKENPLMTEKQADRVAEALESLKEQSDNEGFGFVALDGVPQIGARILSAEKSYAPQ